MERGQSSNSVKNTIITWLFPSLVSILGYIIYQDVAEIKADVKALMAQSNIDKTRIDALERAVFAKLSTAQYKVPIPPDKMPAEYDYHKAVAIKPDDEPIKIIKSKTKK